ncbi:H-type small acid-soluble spore protein [Clostridium ganghwense]|uniref:H-type small acid-soluble spore protein n=1 Tax=Clostridium ganghwense TaxID=312089 RepID=A0ABT4CSL7_9CLOT|nr:H-type small acid-soluble spore protein [Clostridium ganghwense]MCY6371413.1 H-type small acid-soluble spore protein [Clostridium ganghwense]
MNSGRAEQIINSKENITVYYKNTPVYLKAVNHTTHKVTVKNLNNDKDFVVHAKTLNENYGLES